MLHQQITDVSVIHYQEATALAALIRTKQLSSHEVVQAHLDRIQAVKPKINAMVTLMAEQALTSADAGETVSSRSESNFSASAMTDSTRALTGVSSTLRRI